MEGDWAYLLDADVGEVLCVPIKYPKQFTEIERTDIPAKTFRRINIPNAAIAETEEVPPTPPVVEKRPRIIMPPNIAAMFKPPGMPGADVESRNA